MSWRTISEVERVEKLRLLGSLEEDNFCVGVGNDKECGIGEGNGSMTNMKRRNEAAIQSAK